MSAEIGIDKMVFRKTHEHTGRHISVSPENSAMKHLAYGRIILNPSKPIESFSNGERETGLIMLSGQAAVTVDGEEIQLEKYDAIYVPRDSKAEIRCSTNADIAEFSAGVANRYPLQVVHFSQVSNDPGLNFKTGGSGSSRHLHMLLAKNVEAGRLVAGFTISEPGSWTSWPPHEHAKMLEEMYVYIEMPAPGFGVQFVYTDPNDPDLVSIVREGDAVLMPRGYHPNVSAPGHRIGFLWAMAAHRDTEDRQFGVVNVQPEFSVSGSGLEASRK